MVSAFEIIAEVIGGFVLAFLLLLGPCCVFCWCCCICSFCLCLFSLCCVRCFTSSTYTAAMSLKLDSKLDLDKEEKELYGPGSELYELYGDHNVHAEMSDEEDSEDESQLIGEDERGDENERMEDRNPAVFDESDDGEVMESEKEPKKTVAQHSIRKSIRSSRRKSTIKKKRRRPPKSGRLSGDLGDFDEDQYSSDGENKSSGKDNDVSLMDMETDEEKPDIPVNEEDIEAEMVEEERESMVESDDGDEPDSIDSKVKDIEGNIDELENELGDVDMSTPQRPVTSSMANTPQGLNLESSDESDKSEDEKSEDENFRNIFNGGDIGPPPDISSNSSDELDF